MKRFTLLLTLVLLFALAACGEVAEPIVSAEPTLNTAKAELAAAASPSASAAALTPEASPTPDRGVTIETEHFIITNSGEPEKTVTALANALEDNFERITTTLKVVILDKTNVRLYPDNDSLKAAAHQNDSGDYDGLYYGRTLMIKTAMPEMDAYDYFSVVAVHEFVHHAQQKVNSKAPAYLREGMAVYLTESEPVLRRATVALTVRNEKFPSMIRLTTMDSGDGAYEFGYAAIDYIVSEYGFDKFLEFYAKPDTKTSLGIESKIFHENLIKYISETYELPDFDNLNDAPFQFTIDSTDFTDAGKTETFTINGKDYTGVYIGVSDISGLGGKNASREFWLLENAYEDVKDIPKRGDMLPYNNFPVQVELGQVFALRYHYTDDTTLIVYMRSSGFIWQNMTSAEEFPSTK